MPQNHIIDPTYFYDAIEQFAFNFDWYVVNASTIDDLGRRINSFDKKIIRGSLQSQGISLKQDIKLNSEDMDYRFYCKSLYRIKIGDFMFYKNRWLHVESVRDFDEWGVRSARLKMVNLNDYRDFNEYINYLNGGSII